MLADSLPIHGYAVVVFYMYFCTSMVFVYVYVAIIFACSKLVKIWQIAQF